MDAPARVERALTGSEPGFLPLEDGAMEQMEEFESSSLGWQPSIIDLYTTPALLEIVEGLEPPYHF